MASKDWWQSRTIWGLIATAVAMFLRAKGYDVDSGELATMLLDIVASLGLALAWWGRTKATAPIDQRQVAPGVRIPGGNDDAIRQRVRDVVPDDAPTGRSDAKRDKGSDPRGSFSDDY